MRAEIRQIPYNVADVWDENGNFDYKKIWGNVRSTTLRIRREEIEPSPFIGMTGAVWDIRKVWAYLERTVEYEAVITESYRVDLTDWILRTQTAVCRGPAALVIKRSHWLPHFRERGHTYGFRVLSYFDWCLWSPRVVRVTKRLGRVILDLMVRVPSGGRRFVLCGLRWLRGDSNSQRKDGSVVGARVAIRRYSRSLSLDPSVKSEFTWLHESNIPTSEVLVFDYVTTDRMDPLLLAELKQHGVELVGSGPGVPRWVPTMTMVGVLMPIVLKLAAGWLVSVVRLRWVPLFYLLAMGRLALEFSFYYDMFKNFQVRTLVNHHSNGQVSQVLAVDALQGVSASFQYSAAIVLYGGSYLTAGEDVQFTFSKMFDELWHSIDAPNRCYVNVGFYPTPAKYVRDTKRPEGLRRGLHECGARYVICYCDESTSDNWDSRGVNDIAIRDYRFLLNWMIEDASLGMVFKPKKPASIFQRIGVLEDLIEEATASGRCVFLTGGHDQFITEAALAADLCVGHMAGTTSALEAHFAGVPSVVMNTDNWQHPYRQLLDGIVYDDWPSLRQSVEEFRSTPSRGLHFGSWPAGIEQLDPFRDCMGGERIGAFVGAVHDALKRGGSKQVALEAATAQYSSEWGEENIKVKPVS
jgi:hypothetical protein